MVRRSSFRIDDNFTPNRTNKLNRVTRLGSRRNVINKTARRRSPIAKRHAIQNRDSCRGNNLCQVNRRSLIDTSHGHIPRPIYFNEWIILNSTHDNSVMGRINFKFWTTTIHKIELQDHESTLFAIWRVYCICSRKIAYRYGRQKATACVY